MIQSVNETKDGGKIGYIMRNISQAALLEQLAEECTELAKAALKLARIERDENPTPVTRDEAIEALCEELCDVYVCEILCELDYDMSWRDIDNHMDEKVCRWAERIREAKERDGDGG
jgi:NTP pyrophosphatase (non-canonical NTP hydrolase)